MVKRLQLKGLPDSFCFKPWNEVYSHFDTSGPCCINYKLHNGGFASYTSSPELTDLRNSFLRGEKHPSCSACWKTEAAGVRSVRQGDTNYSKKLNRISISLSNKCNFKCMMCNPEDSSSWSLDVSACEIRGMEPVLNEKDLSNIDWIIEKAKTSKIILTVMGGEPLICEEYLYLLEQIEKYNLFENISLVLTTNLSVLSYREVDHLKMFSKFSAVDIYASFDGVATVGEYIRYGFSSEKFENNLIKAKQFVNYFSTTIMLYNIYDLPNIFDYADKFGVSVNFNFLTDPYYLSVGVLSKSERDSVLNYYDEVGFKNEEIINLLNTINFIDAKSELVSYTRGLDTIWNRNILDYIPELKSIL